MLRAREFVCSCTYARGWRIDQIAHQHIFIHFNILYIDDTLTERNYIENEQE